ncbi:MAG: FAD-dependent oxidoreductase, partial [Planctomycetaceae bacterium]
MSKRKRGLMLSAAGLLVAGLLLTVMLSLPVQPVAAVGPDGPEPESSAQRPTDAQHVLVVGAGISGLTAALELGRGGAEVTVVDMSSVFGGHAVMSQGGVSVIGTTLQQEAGLHDNAEMAYRDFLAWGEDADPDWVRYYVDHSRIEIYEWLLQLGVRFESVLTAPGNSVDRFHQPAGRGIALVTPIYEACLKT